MVLLLTRLTTLLLYLRLLTYSVFPLCYRQTEACFTKQTLHKVTVCSYERNQHNVRNISSFDYDTRCTEKMSSEKNVDLVTQHILHTTVYLGCSRFLLSEVCYQLLEVILLSVDGLKLSLSLQFLTFNLHQLDPQL